LVGLGGHQKLDETRRQGEPPKTHCIRHVQAAFTIVGERRNPGEM
jgi:hypothetical protein